MAGDVYLQHHNRQAAKEQGWVTHTYKVIATARSLLSLLQDAETGQRGFILTGEASYLEPFQ